MGKKMRPFLAVELETNPDPNIPVVMLKGLVMESEHYEEGYVREVYQMIVNSRIEGKQRELEFQELELEARIWSSNRDSSFGEKVMPPPIQSYTQKVFQKVDVKCEKVTLEAMGNFSFFLKRVKAIRIY
ncbi:hypothetical protein AVEN_213237-1 [Araneus ventricosus]|uniref:Uncharacterized protein n=1 Tax=Araneus ventricosus TaxID=182803 RepID=A0A4Y2TCN5_ARAVE|nr:hypothetical protein AVEN_213237-1 [Araneus ventricosus]